MSVGPAEPLELVGIPAADVLQRLGTTTEGLSEADAAARLRLLGPNELPRAATVRRLRMLLANFVHLLAVLLWVATALALIAGLPELAVAVVAVIVVNGVFAFLQEDHADRLLRALESQVPLQVVVRRNGAERSLTAPQLVPGDIVLLREGDRVPADARVIASTDLQVDNSSLTGESEPQRRTADVATGVRAVVDAPNLVFAGTVVLAGEATVVTYATGARTELGRIASRVRVTREMRSPLERQIDRVARTTAAIAVAVGLFVLLLALTLGDRSAGDALIFSVGVIVALTPEGLLPTVSLGLALGASRIAQKNGVVRRLSAVESLGSATVICTDKTGTLTMNRFSAVKFWTPGQEESADIPGLGAAYAQLSATAVLASEVDRADDELFGDPIDVALARLDASRLPRASAEHVFPFDPALRRTTVVRRGEDGLIAYVKGAPDHVLDLCASPTLDGEAEAAARSMAREGLRVIALAHRQVDPAELADRGSVERDLVLDGLVGFLDPPRPGVEEAVQRCRRAGIAVHVMSGDHPETARAVAERVGVRASAVVTGADLDRMTEDELSRTLSAPVVFARVTPDHKLRVVEALQRKGEIVAVTGDGVNDAPALRRADVGVAMGQRGTEAARQAADIILTDDDFSTIVAAVEEGRTIFDNIRKFAAYVFTSNVAELAPFIAFILLDVPLAVPVLLVLAIDLGTDLVPALALAAEPPEPRIMERAPRPPSEAILSRGVLLRALAFLGVIEAILGMAFFFGRYAVDGWRPGDALADTGPVYEAAKAAAFAGIVGGQVGALFACRSVRQLATKLSPMRNRLLFVGLAWELAVAALILYAPPLSGVFGVRNPGLIVLATPIGALLVILLDDARKTLVGVRRRRDAGSHPMRGHE